MAVIVNEIGVQFESRAGSGLCWYGFRYGYVSVGGVEHGVVVIKSFYHLR